MTDMSADRESAILAVQDLVRGDSFAFILNELKSDISLSIIRTNFNQKDEREELYMLTKAIDALNVKLQEYVNSYNRIQENK